jgi:hypothetical protein
MLFRKTGATQDAAPVEYRHWKEVVDEFDQDLEAAALNESEEAVVDLWLEDPRSFMEGEVDPGPGRLHTGSMVRRMQTGGSGLRRAADPMAKTASESNWDQEFADAKAHAASVLGNLGNAR